MTHAGSFYIGLAFLAVVLLDAFQTIILPRRPTGRLRITRMFFVATWMPWRAAAKLLRSSKMREQAYSIYGPLSLLQLIVVWAVFLIFAFGFMFYGLGTPFHDELGMPSEFGRLRDSLYVCGTTPFTPGLGVVTTT